MDLLLDTTFEPFVLVKLVIMFAMFLYIIFAIVIVRQVGIMNKTLNVGFEIQLQFIAWGHLLFAIGTFILAFLIL